MGIKKRLQEIRARKQEIRQLLESGQPVDLAALDKELQDLNQEERDLEHRLELASGIQSGNVQARTVEGTGSIPENGASGIPGVPASAGVQVRDASEDKYSSLEYRRAFMNYILRGEQSDILEFRADQSTLPSDVSAVIPTTILNRILEKMEEYGRIWPRVTKISVRGGVEIPVSSLKPNASWVAAGTVVDKQKMSVTQKIVFSYHKLQVRVAVELVASVVSLPVFEQLVADNVAEAMVRALEEAIITGSGSGEPLGIINHTNIPAAQVVSVSPKEFGMYQTWPQLLRKMPRRYRNGMVLIMNDADFGKYIEGMVDQNGQPVARVSFGLNGTIDERFLGREVLAIEEYLPSIDDADPGDVVAILTRPADYMVNTNLQLTYRRYFDENTDEWVSKSTMITDGKLADFYGTVLIKKKEDEEEEDQ